MKETLQKESVANREGSGRELDSKSTVVTLKDLLAAYRRASAEASARAHSAPLLSAEHLKWIALSYVLPALPCAKPDSDGQRLRHRPPRPDR